MMSTVTRATTPSKNSGEKRSAMAGVKAWGSSMPSSVNTTELMRNTMMRQNPLETIWRWAAAEEVSRGWRSAITRPAATTARMPLVEAHSAKRNTKKGENTS